MESKSSSTRTLLWLALIALLLGAVLLVWLGRGASFGELNTPDPAAGPAPGDRVTVSGVTLDGETGARLAGALVGCEGGDVESGVDGSFACRQQTVGSEIGATKEGFFDADPARVEGRPITLVLTQRAFVSGTTVASGEPVAGASLSVLTFGGRDGRDPVAAATGLRSSASGIFRLDVRPGRLRVLAEAEGYAQGESREIKVLGGTERRDVVIDLTPRGSLEVTVLDPHGEPVVGAFVEILGATSWQSHSQTSAADGRTVFDSLPEGRTQVRVSSPRFSVTDSNPVKIVRDRRTSVTVKMAPLAGLVGLVVDDQGAPVARASVLLRPVASPSSTNIALSNARGEFRFQGLDAGQVELTATHTAFSPSTIVRVETGTREVVKLQLHTGGRISGRVFDPDGDPIDERFTFGIERFTPDSGALAGAGESMPGSGHFGPQVMQVPPDFTTGTMVPGLYDLYAETRSFGPGRVTGVRVTAGRTTEDVRITLTRGATVTGRVVNSETGDGVEGAMVFYASLSVPRTPRSARTDADGNFVIEGVSPGRRSISASKTGFMRRILAGLNLSGGRTEDVLIELTPVGDEGPQTEFFGIGAVLQSTDRGTVRVQRLLDDGPASASGLTEGVEILTVDGQDTSRLGLGRTVELIRGDEGASVVLEIQKPGAAIPSEITIERGRVRYKNSPRRRR